MAGSSALKSALWHASQGVHVFPLQVGDKRPLKGSHGELDGTLDLDQIAKIWSVVPWNIGAALRFGDYFALDIDSRSGGHELLETVELEHGRLPSTVTVISASGWPSHHLWFRKSKSLKDCRVRSLGIGIDVKGLGHGYVLVPPSETPKGVYKYEATSYLGQSAVAECPSWLSDRLLSMARCGVNPTKHTAPVEARRFWLGQLFAELGDLGAQIKPGVFVLRCPQQHLHSCGKEFDGSTVLYAPNVMGDTRKTYPFGAVFCLHAHCSNLTDDFLELAAKKQSKASSEAASNSAPGNSAGSQQQ